MQVNKITYKYEEPPIQEDLIIKMLPFEVLEKILLLVNIKDNQSNPKVSVSWSEISVSAKYKEFNRITNLAKSVAETLTEEAYASVKSELLTIGNRTKIYNLVNLNIFKETSELKESVLNILKNLNKLKLEDLEKLSKNKREIFQDLEVFENIFALALLYKHIEDIPNSNQAHLRTFQRR